MLIFIQLYALQNLVVAAVDLNDGDLEQYASQNEKGTKNVIASYGIQL